jgi:hypothetical protein
MVIDAGDLVVFKFTMELSGGGFVKPNDIGFIKLKNLTNLSVLHINSDEILKVKKENIRKLEI